MCNNKVFFVVAVKTFYNVLHFDWKPEGLPSYKSFLSDLTATIEADPPRSVE